MKNELANNLRTIAKSGTKAFLEAMSACGDFFHGWELGFGFSSACLVLDKVRVVSLNNDVGQCIWELVAGTLSQC